MQRTFILGLALFSVTAVFPVHAQSAKRTARTPVQEKDENLKLAQAAYDRGLIAEKEQDWPAAFAAYVEAARRDHGSREYLLRREIARSRLVEAAVQRAERDVLMGEPAAAREELKGALALDPSDDIVRERLAQLSPIVAQELRQFLVEPGGPIQLQPLSGTRTIDFHGDTSSAYIEVAKEFGVDASFDSELTPRSVWLRVTNVDFATAMRVLGDMTDTFWRPLTPKLFFVAADTPEKRRAYGVSAIRTVELPSSATADDMTEMSRVIRDIAGITRTELSIPNHTLTLRASPQALAVATRLLDQLEQPPGEVVLEIEVLEVDRNAARQLGMTPPTSVSLLTVSPQQLQEAQQSTAGLVSVIEQLFGSSGSTAGLSASQLASLLGSGELGIGSLIPPLIAFGGGRTTFLATLPGAAAAFSDTLNLVRSGQRLLLRTENDQPVSFFVGDRIPVSLTALTSGLGSSGSIPSLASNVFPENTYSTGEDPVAVATGDFNGDGKTDIAVANHMSNTVSIFLGNGDGTFNAAGTFQTGNGPIALAAADFNGDGETDLAVVNQTDNTVSIFLGNGDGTFTLKNTFPAGNNPVAIAAADINGDGKLDLAVVNQSDSTVSIFLGNGDGTFTAIAPIATGIGPSAITTGDFNGDGKLDLAIANQAANTVSILLGNGDGTFGPRTDLAVGSSPEGIVAADFNADSKLDLAVANEGDNTVSILLGNGDGTFQPQAKYAGGANPVSLVSADFNIDGRPDLAVADQGGSEVSVLLGNGDGTFNPPLPISVGTGPAGIAAADFNGDSKPDLAVANSTANSLTVILNSSSLGRGSTTSLTAFPSSEYQDVGLKVQATPYMHLSGDVTIKLHIELRSLTGSSIDNIPVISDRTIDQTVSIKNNETTSLAGLLQSQQIASTNGTPGLAGLGAAGLLATNRSNQRSSTELLILVTPRVVRSLPKAGKPIYAGREPPAGNVELPFPRSRPVP